MLKHEETETGKYIQTAYCVSGFGDHLCYQKLRLIDLDLFQGLCLSASTIVHP